MINNKEILPNDPLFDSSIEEIGKKFRDGSLTCVELTSIYYRRINFLNPKLNAYIYPVSYTHLTLPTILLV